MGVIEAIILGIVQGLTEFLPVSSSGHLELAKAMLGDTSVPSESMMMTVVLHSATALSTMVVYRNDIFNILKGLTKLENNESWRFVLYIVLSMIPAAFVGLYFEEELEMLFDKNILLVGMMLFVTGLLLFLADKATRTDKSVGVVNAIIIGISQAIAILPGISRSGATISTSVLLRIDRAKAARFSFLMVVPLILGKIAKDVLSGELAASSTPGTHLIAGFVAAFVAGLFACQWMIALVKRSKLIYFSIYCFIVGTLSILYVTFFA
jgi:undecaprenyl-diphosphatase